MSFGLVALPAHADLSQNDGILHAEQFGCVGDGKSNNDGCASKLALACKEQCSVEFGAGRFLFSAPWDFVFPDDANRALSIRGQGAGVTNLLFKGTDGVRVTYAAHHSDSSHFKDFTIIQTSANVGTGISVTGSSALQVDPSTFENVTLLAAQITNGGWATGIALKGVSFVNFNGVSWFAPNSNLGTGISIQGQTEKKAFAIQFQFANCIFQNGAVGILYGPYIQGVQISNSQFTNMDTAIVVASEGAAQLFVSNSQIDTQKAGVVINSPIAQFGYSNNLQYIHPGQIGIGINAYATGNINNSDFSGPGAGSGSIGIFSADGLSPAISISGNRIAGFDTGIYLGKQSQGFLVYNNTFVGTGLSPNKSDVVNAGSASQKKQ